VNFRRMLLIAISLTVAVTGVAVAGHVPQEDPNNVPPTGTAAGSAFLVAHNSISFVPKKSLKRVANWDGTDTFVQHIRLDANAATPWHTHPGPTVVGVVEGSLIYEHSRGGECRQKTYEAGTGFIDPGFGKVHRAIAGESGADFYATYVLRQGSENHLIMKDPPEACA
jgi:quercetin dioxygenase-like cupin family protein